MSDKIPYWSFLPIALLSISLAVWLVGCATTDLRAHEERHCEGDVHQIQPAGDVAFRYEWSHVRSASEKPWVYTYVDDPDTTCRLRNVQGAYRHDLYFNACATWHPKGCEIILPKELEWTNKPSR